MRNRRRTRFFRRLALALVVAALVAPAATQARVDEGGSSGGVDAYVPFKTDFPKPAAAPTGEGVPVAAPQAVPVAAEPGGFSWSDGLIGFGAGLGLALLALGGVLATRHLGRAATAG